MKKYLFIESYVGWGCCMNGDRLLSGFCKVEWLSQPLLLDSLGTKWLKGRVTPDGRRIWMGSGSSFQKLIISDLIKNKVRHLKWACKPCPTPAIKTRKTGAGCDIEPGVTAPSHVYIGTCILFSASFSFSETWLVDFFSIQSISDCLWNLHQPDFTPVEVWSRRKGDHILRFASCIRSSIFIVY